MTSTTTSTTMVPARPTAAAGPDGTQDWVGLHCFVHWDPADLDEFLCRTLAPLLDGARAAGRLADWFYLRYWEGGPHLRVRLRGAEAATTGWLRTELADRIAAAPYQVLPWDGERYRAGLGGPAARSSAGWQPHGAVREVPYRPEIERYGGAAALPVAEDVFCRSTALAVRLVAAAPRPGARLGAAAELTMSTALALGLDRLGAARWLRMLAGSWRWHAETAMAPAAAVLAQSARALATRAPALHRRWEQLRVPIHAGPDRPAPSSSAAAAAGQWAETVRAARQRLEPPAPGHGPAAAPGHGPAPVPGRWWPVWGSQLHMLMNRLGVTPDEERSVCWLVAAACLAPAGPAGFFDDGAEAPDRRYHEASKFMPGWEDRQLPRDSGAPAGRPAYLPAREPVRLPPARPPVRPLAEVLRRRTSGRGRLAGPVTAEDLSTLLWGAHGVTHTGTVRLPDGTDHQYAHRPYPSAGASYPARLRVLVRDVAGVAPGCYLADPAQRVLRWLGPAASTAELAAASMWFGADALDRGGIDVAELPALLGLYADLGSLRSRYGLRGLRFAALEAGHLAQTLALVGTATDLAVGMIGGFYDDLGHELFGLDGVDDALFYLLPVGRWSGGRQ